MNNLTQPQTYETLIHRRRMRDIKKYGCHAMSYSAVQQGIQEFRHPAFKGFIPYMTVWGVDYVLSNPVTPSHQYLLATLLFLEHRKNVVFCQITKNYATMLSFLGVQISPFGVEHIIPLSDFSVTWKERRSLKRFCSRLANKKYYVFENLNSEHEAQMISRQWLSEKQKATELCFLARPFVSTREEDVRTFYLIKDKKVLGFCTFDPIYSNDSDDEKPVSYVLQHLRQFSDSPNGSGDYLLVNSIQQLKEDGISEVSLGLAPLHDRSDRSFMVPWKVQLTFDWFYKTKFLYHFEDLGKHKERYRGLTRQTYIASFQRFTWKNLAGLLKVNNLI